MNNKGFLTDFKRIQEISGLAAFTGILMTILLLIFVPLDYEAKRNILLIALSALGFTIVYYLIPKIYLNTKLAFLPDIVYIISITLVMMNVGKYGYVYFVFYMILAAVDAFIFPLWQYAIVIGSMCIGIFLANLGPNFEIQSQIIYQIYGVITLSVVTHLISRDALKIKGQKENLEQEIAALEADKREIRSVLESLTEGMFVVDEKNKIIFYNKSALEILNIITTPEKILGKDINDIMNTVGPDGPEQITRKVFGSLEPVRRNDLRLVMADRVIKLSANITPVLGEGSRLEGGIIFFRDITKEKNLEEQRAEFNAIASHELRTPLSVIEGYLYFILDPASGAKYDAVTKDYIQKAHAASRELIQLITDVLTVVKAEDNELDVKLEKINFDELIKSIIIDYQKQADAKKIKLKYKTTAKKIPEIETDRIKVKEIISNLIGNAIKFTDEGSVEVFLGLLEKELMVEVSDTGPGIALEDQKMVFQKFFRSENWKTRKTGGTGLGLYIVKVLTERLGGRVGLQSKLGKGSKFFFALPLEFSGEVEDN